MQSSSMTKDEIAFAEMDKVEKAVGERVREFVVYGSLDPLRDSEKWRRMITENWSLDDLAKNLKFGPDKADPIYDSLKEKLARLGQNTDLVATNAKLAADAIIAINDHLQKAKEKVDACAALVIRYLKSEPFVSHAMVQSKLNDAVGSFNTAVRLRKDMRENKLHSLTFPTFLLDQAKDLIAEYNKIPKPSTEKAQLFWKYSLDVVLLKIGMASAHMKNTMAAIKGEKTIVERLNLLIQEVKQISGVVARLAVVPTPAPKQEASVPPAVASHQSGTTASALSRLSLSEQKSKAGFDTRPVHYAGAPAKDQKEEKVTYVSPESRAKAAAQADALAEAKSKTAAAAAAAFVKDAGKDGKDQKNSIYLASGPTVMRAPVQSPMHSSAVLTRSGAQTVVSSFRQPA